MKKFYELFFKIIAAVGFVWMVGVLEPTINTFACGAALFIIGAVGMKIMEKKNTKQKQEQTDTGSAE